jgi:hypothetical protein
MPNYITLTCEYCNKEFKRELRTHNQRMQNNAKHIFCSNTCRGNYDYNNKSQIVLCSFCNNKIIRQLNEIKRNLYQRFFCNRSCAAKYYNSHKTTGCNRSKLEIYLAEQIELNYPELKCIYNNTETINAELDFYFPTLKLAIELNGIFHYEPIYGQDRLEKIQLTDQQKILLCNQNNIEICIIDSSSCQRLTQNQKDKYWSIVNNIIQNIYKRHLT